MGAGVAAGCARALAYQGLRLGLFSPLRAALPGGDGLGAALAAGALTGALGSALSSPFDVAKASETRRETERARDALYYLPCGCSRRPVLSAQVRQQGGERKHENSAAALVARARIEGARGLWRAAPLTVVRASAASSCSAQRVLGVETAHRAARARRHGGDFPAAHALASVPAALACALAAAVRPAPGGREPLFTAKCVCARRGLCARMIPPL